MEYQKLSKEISYALRHAPNEYELDLDEQGWVCIDQLLYSLRERLEWSNLNENDLYSMIVKSEKKRHEIKEGKIRALYGHSVSKKIIKEEKEPPVFLYHGTLNKFLPFILEKGLIPKGRQYVHLSEDVETAMLVGLRRDEQPVILKIDAKRARAEGTKFYHGNEMVWLADLVGKQYISIYK